MKCLGCGAATDQKGIRFEITARMDVRAPAGVKLDIGDMKKEFYLCSSCIAFARGHKQTIGVELSGYVHAQ